MNEDNRTTVPFLRNQCEKYEELNNLLQTSVLSPLENTIGVLRNAWTDDPAAAVFLKGLEREHDLIRDAMQQIWTVSCELAGFEDETC